MKVTDKEFSSFLEKLAILTEEQKNIVVSLVDKSNNSNAIKLSDEELSFLQSIF